MKLLNKSTFILCLFLLSLNANSLDQQSYLVESIEDGDTIVVNFKGKSQRIQLTGIDAPENTVNPKFKLDIKVKKIPKESLLEVGNLATNFLKEQLATGQKVELQGDLSKADRYGRIPAIVINEKGVSLNQRMIAAGYAIVIKRYPFDEDLKIKLQNAEQQAREEKRGLWTSHPDLMKTWAN